jgi:hypothetical protein
MEPNPIFSTLATDDAIQTTAAALQANGFTVHVVDSGAAARTKVLELIPAGAEVMTMTSVTLDTLGLPAELNESGRYDAIRPKLNQMSEDQADAKRKLAAAPNWVIGSVHALTHDGHVFMASNTGSQMAAHVYAAGQVIWVVGAQKIVANDDLARQRIYEYSFPLEAVRAKAAYGIQSNVSKILQINKEVNPTRATIIIVKEKLGF